MELKRLLNFLANLRLKLFVIFVVEIQVADRERFELSVILRLRILSRDVVSANSPICPCKKEA